MFHYRYIAVTILSSVRNDIKSLFAAARKIFVVFVVRMLTVIASNNLCISDRPLMLSTFYFRRRERNPDRAAVQHISCRMHFLVCFPWLCSSHRPRIAFEWATWMTENNNATSRKLRDTIFDLIAVGHKVDDRIYQISRSCVIIRSQSYGGSTVENTNSLSFDVTRKSVTAFDATRTTIIIIRFNLNASLGNYFLWF